MKEVTRIRTGKEIPVQMTDFMARLLQPKIFVRRLGASFVARFMPQGAQVDESGMPFCHRFTGNTMKDIERQARKVGCTALLEFDDCVA